MLCFRKQCLYNEDGSYKFNHKVVFPVSIVTYLYDDYESAKLEATIENGKYLFYML